MMVGKVGNFIGFYREYEVVEGTEDGGGRCMESVAMADINIK
jgi:hypothetical protein